MNDSVIGHWWRTAPGVSIDTDVEPHWMRTGYRYFPFAAFVNGRRWVIRVNYCFPEHDFATLFIDAAAAAEITASVDDARPLIASIGRLPMTHPDDAAWLPLMRPDVALEVVGEVAAFVDHGSECGLPCDMCTFAVRDPFTPAGKG